MSSRTYRCVKRGLTSRRGEVRGDNSLNACLLRCAENLLLFHHRPKGPSVRRAVRPKSYIIPIRLQHHPLDLIRHLQWMLAINGQAIRRRTLTTFILLFRISGIPNLAMSTWIPIPWQCIRHHLPIFLRIRRTDRFPRWLTRMCRCKPRRMGPIRIGCQLRQIPTHHGEIYLHNSIKRS